MTRRMREDSRHGATALSRRAAGVQAVHPHPKRSRKRGKRRGGRGCTRGTDKRGSGHPCFYTRSAVLARVCECVRECVGARECDGARVCVRARVRDRTRGSDAPSVPPNRCFTTATSNVSHMSHTVALSNVRPPKGPLSLMVYSHGDWGV